MSNLTNMVEAINSFKYLTDVVENELVRQQFINVYNAVWKEGGEQAYEREANFFNKILRENGNLAGCTCLSVYFAFIDLAVQGISVEPGARAMAYLLPRKYKMGKDGNGNDVYEKRCNLTISGYGELYLRARAGQIHHADNPVVVYEGDGFEYGERDGHKYVNYSMHIPRTSHRIIACFLKITRTDGTIDYSVMLEQDWQRLAGYSGRNNRYYDKEHRQWVERVNELYTSDDGGIDPSFLCSKCIKHAFRTYPKLNIGKGTQLETTVADDADPNFDPYGGVDMSGGDAAPANESFAAPTDTSNGVKIDPAAPQAQKNDGGQSHEQQPQADDCW